MLDAIVPDPSLRVAGITRCARSVNKALRAVSGNRVARGRLRTLGLRCILLVGTQACSRRARSFRCSSSSENPVCSHSTRELSFRRHPVVCCVGPIRHAADLVCLSLPCSERSRSPPRRRGGQVRSINLAFPLPWKIEGLVIENRKICGLCGLIISAECRYPLHETWYKV